MTTLEYLELWHELEERPRDGVVTFVRRVFQKTRAYEERFFYLPDRRRLFSVDCPQLRPDFWPFAFYIKPGDTLDECKRKPQRPDTFFLERVVYSRRRGRFVQDGPGLSLESFMPQGREAVWQSHVLFYVLDVPACPDRIAALKEACDTHELHIPARA